MPDSTTPKRETSRARSSKARAPDSLATRWSRIQGKLEAIPRNGYATVATSRGEYSYSYVMESDLMEALRPLLAEEDVASFYSDRIVSVTPVGDRGQLLVHVRCQLVLVCGETDERVELDGEDIALDYGDKGARKAKTGAVRYLLLKGTLNPSDAQDDPDSEQNVQHADPPAAPEPEPEPSPSSEPRRRRAPEVPRRQKLAKRIVDLCGEYDVLSEQRPGSTGDALVAQLGGDLDDEKVSEDWLVFAGKELAKAVNEAKAASERGSKVEPFTLDPTKGPPPF